MKGDIIAIICAAVAAVGTVFGIWFDKSSQRKDAKSDTEEKTRKENEE